jgi:hypothetical protein
MIANGKLSGGTDARSGQNDAKDDQRNAGLVLERLTLRQSLRVSRFP